MEDNKLAEWLKSDTPLTREMFDDYKVLTRKLPSSDQLLFIKKVANEIAKNNISLSISDLLEIKTYSLDTVQDFGEPQELDYTLDLILHTLKLIDLKQEFPHDIKEVYLLVKNLADFICDYLQNNVEYLTKINLLFDNCPGRTAIVNKRQDEAFISLRGNDYKVYGMYQGYSIINRDKTGWGELVLHYEGGIYAKGKVCMIEIKSKKTDRHGYDNIVYGENIEYNGKLYPFQWKKDENNYLITPDAAPVESCEGRKSPILCNLSDKEFWWCYGRKCFKANQVDHTTTEWKNYSLRDILKILKLPFDEIGYYIFVSEINRLNRLLNRIKCNDCQHILRPSKQTHFGFYRVSHFHCNNDKHNHANCPSYHKVIYLTHCLNSKCTNVVDDRVAKRCPNGFIICDKCGSCCSNDQFARRIQALRTNGQNVSQKLIDMLNYKVGHWEKAECYCYKCEKEMIEGKNGDLTCKECDVHYDRYNVYISYSKDYKTIREAKRKKEQANKQAN
jgi:hypothetical protein